MLVGWKIGKVINLFDLILKIVLNVYFILCSLAASITFQRPDLLSEYKSSKLFPIPMNPYFGFFPCMFIYFTILLSF